MNNTIDFNNVPPFFCSQKELLLSQRNSPYVCDSFFEKFSSFCCICILIQKTPCYL